MDKSSLFLVLCRMLGLGILFSSLLSPMLRAADIAMEDGSPIRIQVKRLFTEGPTEGHVPIRVTITNRSDRDGVWQMTNSVSYRGFPGNGSGSYNLETGHRLAVPAGSSRDFDFSVPGVPDVTANPTARGYFPPVTLESRFTGPDTLSYSNDQVTLQSGGSGHDRASLLLSPDIHRVVGNEFQKMNNSSGWRVTAGTYYNPDLSTDWRSYVGYDLIVFSAKDWEALSPEIRRTVLKAVASGRVQLRFHLPNFNAETARALDIPADQPAWAHGLGVIARYDTDLNEDFWRAGISVFGKQRGLFELSSPLPQEFKERDRQALEQAATLEKQIGDRTPPVAAISIGVLIFAILMGPVNLLVFAKGNRRMRLFVTTPIIAVGASVLLFAGIFLVDGVGGEGVISRVIYLPSGSNEAYVVQDQFSSTGLLFGTRFTAPERSLVRNRGASVGDPQNLELAGNFSVNGDVYSGGWFANKRVQAQNLSVYLPTRERIERVPSGADSGAPVLFSNFKGICETLFYIDENGRYWRGTNLKLGAQLALEPTSVNDFEQWYRNEVRRSGADMQALLAGAAPRRNHVYATVGNWQQAAGFTTLAAIDWTLHSQMLVAEVSPGKTKGAE